MLTPARESARLVAWAVHAPHRTSGTEEFETLLVADMAGAAGGDTGAVRMAARVAREGCADRWRLELSLERARRAERLTGARHAGGRGLGAVRCALAGLRGAGALLALLSMPQRTSPLVEALGAVLTIVAVLTGAYLGDARIGLPSHLASTAMLPPAPSVFVLPELSVVELLAEIGRNPAVLDRAEARLPTCERERAERARARLARARRLLQDERCPE